MTTKTGRWHDRHTFSVKSSYPSFTPEDTNMNCARCRNSIWKGQGFYFRPKDGNRWLVFCRRDCAELHLDKTKKNELLTHEEYVMRLVHKAIKEKPE